MTGRSIISIVDTNRMHDTDRIILLSGFLVRTGS
jgi:hypothetical protein